MGNIPIGADGHIYKFRRKLNQVEAVRVTTDNVKEVAKWCGGEATASTDHYINNPIEVILLVPTLNEPIEVHNGNWLLKDEEGRFSKMENHDFKAEYEYDKQTINRN